MKSYIKIIIAYIIGYGACGAVAILHYNAIVVGIIAGLLLWVLDSIETK